MNFTFCCIAGLAGCYVFLHLYPPISVLTPIHYPPAEPAAVLLVDLAAVDAAHLVRILARPPVPLLVDCDCGTLPCQRTLGICFLVSQLLVLRQGGATIWLRNASPVLRRCLQRLQLSAFFPLAD